jgi:hypothetical protein
LEKTDKMIVLAFFAAEITKNYIYQDDKWSDNYQIWGMSFHGDYDKVY